MAKQKLKVFTPFSIGSLTVKNRIVMAATLHEMFYDGHPTEGYLATVASYAASGAGLIIVGGATVDNGPVGCAFPNQMKVSDEECMYGLNRIAETIKARGARSCQQLFHPGRSASMRLVREGVADLEAWAPSSDQPWMFTQKVNVTKQDSKWRVETILAPASVKEMAVDEIEAVVRMHVLAAMRVQRAGFDSVNLHLANATLLMDFMSPFTNRRNDAYGGDWDRRLRFPMEHVQAVKAGVGKDFPVIARLPADQGLGSDGITFDDIIKEIIPRLEEAGVDCFDLSAGILDRTPHLIMPPMYEPRGVWLERAEAVKKVTKLPVIVAGRLCDPRMVIKAVETGRCDFAGLSRPLMADPQMPRKMQEGRLDDVRMCTGCCYCMTEKGWGKNCAINPELSRELILPPIVPAQKPRKILVVGGGPGGMEAARILAERGHEVTLCERREYLGGTLFTASAAPLTREWRSYTKWHLGQIEKLGIKVRLNTDVTRELVEEFGPDAIVIATGSKPRLELPGSGHDIVVSEDDALLKKVELGKRVVVLGGNFWDVETAISLSTDGREVTLVRSGPGIDLARLGIVKGMALLQGLLPKSGVKLLVSTNVEAIKPNGVEVTDAAGLVTLLEADTVVLSAGRVAERSLADELAQWDYEVHEIGDCVKPENVAEAVYAARIVAAGI